MKDKEIDELMKKRKFSYAETINNDIRIYEYENKGSVNAIDILAGISSKRDEFKISCRDKSTMYSVDTSWYKDIADKTLFRKVFLRAKKLVKIVASEIEKEE